MDSLPRPRRGVAARILASIVVVPMLIAACSGSGGGPLGGGGGDPAAVVRDALAKVAAKDVNGLAGLACAGQADQVRKDFDFGNALASSVPGVDPQAITDSISIDTSGVTVGTPVINGDTATVPVSGTMKMNFDKEKLRPIFKQIMEAQGGGVELTDDQIDMFLDQMTGSGQGIPMNESLTLKNEGGSWKICDDASGGGGGPSASINY